MSLGEVDWMPGFSLHQNQLIADALCEVPQLPYPQTPAPPEVMPHPSRANSGTLKGKLNQLVGLFYVRLGLYGLIEQKIKGDGNC
jgi:hypothetical protein